MPERCSKKLGWAFTGNVALGTNDKAIFILSPPNDGKGTNEVLVGDRLKSLKLTLNPPTIANVDKKTIKRNQDVEITVEGANLVGTFMLKKGRTMIFATKVQVVISDTARQFSDLKKVKVTFHAPPATPALKGYKLIVLNNMGGRDDEPGFEIKE